VELKPRCWLNQRAELSQAVWPYEQKQAEDETIDGSEIATNQGVVGSNPAGAR